MDLLFAHPAIVGVSLHRASAREGDVGVGIALERDLFLDEFPFATKSSSVLDRLLERRLHHADAGVHDGIEGVEIVLGYSEGIGVGYLGVLHGPPYRPMGEKSRSSTVTVGR